MKKAASFVLVLGFALVSLAVVDRSTFFSSFHSPDEAVLESSSIDRQDSRRSERTLLSSSVHSEAEDDVDHDHSSHESISHFAPTDHTEKLLEKSKKANENKEKKSSAAKKRVEHKKPSHEIKTMANDMMSGTFDVNTTHSFSPEKSLSFAEVLFERFRLSYADAAGVSGFTGKDVVQLGRYYVHTNFGCITHCESPDFNGVDGILGFGLPDAAVAGLRTPLFLALSDQNRNYDRANDNILNSRQFTVLADDDRGELQLGGYDPDCTEEPLMEVQTTSDAEYSVPLESMRVGDVEIFRWKSARVQSLPAIFDSGTSCLVIPDTLMGGVVEEKPYSHFIKNAAMGKSIFMFDLVHLHGVKIAVGQRKKEYKLIEGGTSEEGDGFHRLSLIRKTKNGDVFFRSPYHKEGGGGADKVPMINAQKTQFFVNVSIGTPRQTMEVIFDTGSSVFAVFCESPHAHSPLHVYLPKFIPSSFLQISQRIWNGSNSHLPPPLIFLLFVAFLLVLTLVVSVSLRKLQRRHFPSNSQTPPHHESYGSMIGQSSQNQNFSFQKLINQEEREEEEMKEFTL